MYKKIILSIVVGGGFLGNAYAADGQWVRIPDAGGLLTAEQQCVAQEYLRLLSASTVETCVDFVSRTVLVHHQRGISVSPTYTCSRYRECFASKRSELIALLSTPDRIPSRDDIAELQLYTLHTFAWDLMCAVAIGYQKLAGNYEQSFSQYCGFLYTTLMHNLQEDSSFCVKARDGERAVSGESSLSERQCFLTECAPPLKLVAFEYRRSPAEADEARPQRKPFFELRVIDIVLRPITD